MYFVVAKTGNLNVEGNLPLTAEEALAFIERSNGNGLPVSVDQLRKEARR